MKGDSIKKFLLSTIQQQLGKSYQTVSNLFSAILTKELSASLELPLFFSWKSNYSFVTKNK